MSKTVPPSPKPAESPKSAAKQAEQPKETTRDFVEQIVVAIILAILIRGFEAEAFVIPTGSMAPTLKGRHMEIECPQCGFNFTISADERNDAFATQNKQLDTVICSNCRNQIPTFNAPRFKGDRILVMKFPYEFPNLPGAGGPDRWDVVVFHYPEEPETNYIKRLVGLPEDEIQIRYGDLWRRKAGTNDAFEILRKPLEHQKAMQMPVYDDRYRPRALKGEAAWARWQAPRGDWSESKPGTFVSPATTNGQWSGLRYRHIVPDPEQWIAIQQRRTPPRKPRATLITDFYGYNATTTGEMHHAEAAWLQHNWVGDLTVSSYVASSSDSGIVRFELVEAGVKNRCEIDLATGEATLFHGTTKLGSAKTALKGKTGRYVTFANVDNRLTLWIGSDTPFGPGLPYEDGPLTEHGPTADDLDPVGIEVNGAGIAVSELVLTRDIYYTQEASPPDVSLPSGFGSGSENPFAQVLRMFEVLSDPARFTPLMRNIPTRSFVIKPDHFMMMGDNSPRSSDSRAWGRKDSYWYEEGDRESWEVPRAMLVGKAFFVYWPHGVPFWPKLGISRDFLIPFRPYFERMLPIR